MLFALDCIVSLRTWRVTSLAWSVRTLTTTWNPYHLRRRLMLRIAPLRYKITLAISDRALHRARLVYYLDFAA